MTMVQMDLQTPDVTAQVRGGIGCITLNRPKAINALSLDMVRALTQALLAWQDDPAVQAVAVRGMGREGPFGAFCAGGDIRFFHQAALAGDPRIEDFFTEEYRLNHLIHHYPKPYVSFMDGIVMGGGMGIAGHGAPGALRIATERTKMAMPETQIGLFPDVGGGWFLARCPGRMGEYLGMTGVTITAADALAVGMADLVVDSGELPGLWEQLAGGGMQALQAVRERRSAHPASALAAHAETIDRFFGLPDALAIVQALEADGGEWAQQTARVLRQRSPLMLQISLELVRRARQMTLAQDLRMERDLVRRCFTVRPGAASETVEGIRALAIDKDHAPKWNPARLEDVTQPMVAAYFDSPWPAWAHPLREL